MRKVTGIVHQDQFELLVFLNGRFIIVLQRVDPYEEWEHVHSRRATLEEFNLLVKKLHEANDADMVWSGDNGPVPVKEMRGYIDRLLNGAVLNFYGCGDTYFCDGDCGSKSKLLTKDEGPVCFMRVEYPKGKKTA